ncbi:MAG: hypothetical protein V7637_761 [Mycobacteriales bacterium]
MTGFAIDLRCTAARFAAPAAAVFSVLYLLSADDWLGVWDETARTASTIFTVSLPLAIAAAGWDARRGVSPRSVHSAVTAPRSALAILASRWGAATAWMLLSYAVVQFTAGLLTAGRSPAIDPGWGFILVGAAAVAAHTAIGLLLGRFLPLLAVIPLSILIGYVGNAALSATPGTPAALLTTLDDVPVTVAQRLKPAVGAVQVVWFVSLALALVALAALLSSTRRRQRAAQALFGITSFATMLSVVAVSRTDGYRVQDVVAAGPRVCSAGDVVCVWRDHGYYLATLDQTATRMLSGLQGWTTGPRGFVENGLSHPADRAPVGGLGNDDSTPELAQSLAYSAIAYAICRGRPGIVAPTADVEDRIRWLTARGLPDEAVGPLPGAVTAIRREPADRQLRWFTARIDPDSCWVGGTPP